MRSIAIVALVVSSTTLNAQNRENSNDPGLFRTFMERVSVRTEIGTFQGRGDYGLQGSASVEFSILPLAEGALLGGEVSVFAGTGLGSRYKTGELSRPLNIKHYFAGISVPILDFAPLVGLPHPFILRASPFYQNALTRNYTTGNHNPVRGTGFSLSLTGFVTEYMGINLYFSRFQGRQPKAGFVWDPISESAGIGLVINLGDLLTDHRLTRTSFIAARENLRERSLEFDRVLGERDSLTKEHASFRDSLLRAAVVLAKMLEAKPQELPSTVPAFQHSTERIESEEYDESRKAPIRVIKIDKPLFRDNDLVEESYLKAILSIISKHSAYVWEIAFRDDAGEGGEREATPAEKIRQFFQIYDSSLNRRITLSHDPSLRTEFEIRCLGEAKRHISGAY